jgi:hypothetical protein
MKYTFVFIESSTSAVTITKRLAHVQKTMPQAMILSKRLYERLTAQPISTKDKVKLLHDLYINVMAFCSKHKDKKRRSSLFKRLVRQVGRIASQEGSYHLAIERVNITLGAE